MANCEMNYYVRMDAAVDDKQKMLDFIKDGNHVLDVGAGSGCVSRMVLERFPHATVVAIDNSGTAFPQLEMLENQYDGRLTAVRTGFFPFDGDKFDVVIFSSVLHELFSYTFCNGRRFNFATVEDALAKAAEMLKPGGRIIIRDGVAPSHNHRVLVQYLDDEMRELADMYEKQFKGFDLKIVHTEHGDVMPRRSAMELLYTITWGKKSFSREVQEWYGYYSLEDWKRQSVSLMTKYGVQLTHIEKYLQQGYADHLEDRVRLLSAPKPMADGNIKTRPANLPASNCLVVFEKV